MVRKLREQWMKTSLRKKLWGFAVMLALVMGLSMGFNIVAMNVVVRDFNRILEDNSRCCDFQEALELEIRDFEGYIREGSQAGREACEASCARTAACLSALPYAYEQIGSERYARTWNVINSYENYSAKRDRVLSMGREEEGYISSLYDVYETQNYLQSYARRLVQATLEEGNIHYLEKLPAIYGIRRGVLAFSAVVLAVTAMLTKLLSHTLVRPLVILADSSKKIARYDFSEPDLMVDNRDEMGDLVKSFNKMKHATEGYINTLKKNTEIAELLYREEMEKVETEKQLEAARLELLKSQINPHFLFNALNTISGTAKLEEAYTTDQMIASLSNLFRYNLKTSDQVVMLERELKVVEDYLFIQKMRFGERVAYECRTEVDPEEVMIPAFTLQPLVENAVIHGISRKEQGGRIFLRVWQKEAYVIVSVADTGVGMAKERYEELCRTLEESRRKGKRTSKTGIGLGNIYKRVYTMYKNGHVKIYSTEQKGCVVQMWIPLERPDGTDEWLWSEGLGGGADGSDTDS